MRFISYLITGLVALAAPAAAFADAPEPSPRLTTCRAGTPEPSRSPDLRPLPTALCPYDLDSLYNRIAALMASGQRMSGITQVNVTLGLPAQPTRYDSRRDANYAVQVTGKGGWTLHLSVVESAFPLDGTPDAFVPGAQPTRIFALDRLDIRYDLRIVAPEGAAADRCLTVKQAADTLLAAGWHDDTMLAAGLVRHGGAAYPHFRNDDGRTLSLPMRTLAHGPSAAEMASTCLGEVIMMQSPVEKEEAR